MIFQYKKPGRGRNNLAASDFGSAFGEQHITIRKLLDSIPTAPPVRERRGLVVISARVAFCWANRIESNNESFRLIAWKQ